jgi:desulfoferrodoxin (superoxide reductase-like protein)
MDRAPEASIDRSKPQRRNSNAALVETISGDSVTVSLVNVNPVEARDVIVQAGAYAEHQFTTPHNARWITVRLEPGAGDRFTLGMKRYANQPTAAQPWDQPRP